MKKIVAALLLALLLTGCGAAPETPPPAAEGPAEEAVSPAPEAKPEAPAPEAPAEVETVMPEIVEMPELSVTPGDIPELTVEPEPEKKPEKEPEQKPEKKPEKKPGESAAAGGGVKLTVSFGEHRYRATLADTAPAAAFAEMLAENGGSITVFSNDFSSVEKIGYLPDELPMENTEMTAAAGDIVLWDGRQLVLYYAENTWGLTRLGRLDNPAGLREALGGGDISITYTLD